MKAAEDKTFPGAVAASLTSPWGQAVSAGDPANTYFGSYREVFARDLYEAWTAVFLAGDRRTATNMTRFLFERQQQPDGSMPRNSLPNGKLAPDSFNTQLDECAYPLIMALAVGLTDNALLQGPHRAGRQLRGRPRPRVGPRALGGAERLLALDHLGRDRGPRRGGDHRRPQRRPRLGARVARHGRRVPAQPQEVDADHQRPAQHRTRTSSACRRTAIPTPRSPTTSATAARRSTSARSSTPASSSTRGSGCCRPSDADIIASLPVVDATIKRTTASGDGFLRYNGDGYGDGATDGHPWAPGNKGTGHPWPVLAGERGQYEVDRGSVGAAIARLDTMRNMSSGVGLIAEQAWDLPDLAASPFGTDPTVASIGFRNGKPDGSASALTWSAGQFVRLTLDAAAGKMLDRPAYTFDRYVRHAQGQTTLSVTAPVDRPPVVDSIDGHRHHDARQQRHRGGHQHRHELHDDDALDDGRRRAAPSRHHPAHRRDVGAQHGGHQPVGRHGARRAHGGLRPGAGDADLRRRRSRQRRQRPGQLRLSDQRRLHAGRLRPPALRGLRRGPGHRLPRPHARPDPDLRQPARRAARRRLRPRARRRHDLDGRRRSRSATT